MLAVAGTLLVILVAVVLTEVLRGGSSGPPSAAAPDSTHHTTAGSATRSPQPTASASPSPALHADPLGAAAQALVDARSGTILAAVYDLRTGQAWTLGQGEPQDEASIVKLDILETLLARHRVSGLPLSADEQALAQEMIEDSDNDAATSLWDEVGGAQGISAYNASAGLTDTTPSICVECPGFPWPGWGLSTTTPADQVALLRELLQPSTQLTAAQQQYALGLMENVTDTQRWGVTGGVPPTVTVALKNGWLPLTASDDDWQINSIGWVAGDRRDYLIAVLTTGNPTEQYGIDTIDQLSAIIWQGMR